MQPGPVVTGALELLDLSGGDAIAAAVSHHSLFAAHYLPFRRHQVLGGTQRRQLFRLSQTLDRLHASSHILLRLLD